MFFILVNDNIPVLLGATAIRDSCNLCKNGCGSLSHNKYCILFHNSLSISLFYNSYHPPDIVNIIIFNHLK